VIAAGTERPEAKRVLRPFPKVRSPHQAHTRACCGKLFRGGELRIGCFSARRVLAQTGFFSKPVNR